MRFRSVVVLVPLACLAACDTFPDTVLLSGSVYDAPYDEGKAVAGIAVTTRDGGLDVFSETVTDASGAFQVEVASQQHLYVALSGDGQAPTLFAGQTGAYDMTVARGALFVRPETWAADLAARFGACASQALAAKGAGTGLIEGEVRLYMAGVSAPDSIVAERAWVTARQGDGTAWEACYLDDEGAPDPDARYTGSQGRFAVFGVPAGPILLLVSYGDRDAADNDDTGEGVWYSWVYEVLMEDNGVAPFYPAWVEQVAR
ncbi:MAG: hypothetical protein JXB39_09310 [Deltaproteobacteria bacterium]|nr:hypothetical protein [Deltaproteobacteria bacterium]